MALRNRGKRLASAASAGWASADAKAIVQDSRTIQRLLDIGSRVDADEGMRQGLEDAKKGKSRPAKEFFAEFEAEHGLSR